METAILYARASTKEQSTKIQVKQLEDYCKRNGLKIKGVYEENISGAATEKECLDAIINAEPMADILLIREVSRLSREKDYVNALAKVNQLVKKYTIHILADNYTIQKGNVLPMNDGIILIVKLYGAADEREKIALRTSEARKRYRENPMNNAAGGTPFGLEKVPNPNYIKGSNTKYIFQPGKDWDKVIEVYTLKAQGQSYTQVAYQTGLDKSLVRNIIRNKRIRFFLPYGLAEEADRQSKLLDSSPTPKRHHNPYKNIVFDGDSDRAMVHQITSKGNRYVVAGKGLILETDLNDTVYKALTTFVRFFQIKRDDLLTQNTLKIENLKTSIQALRDVFRKKTTDISTLRQKAVRTNEMGLYEEIQKRIISTQNEMDKISEQIALYENEIDSLSKVELEDAVITRDNLETYVHRYVKAIRYYPVRTFCRIIRVEIKDEFIPDGYVDYKAYEVYRSHSGNYIKPLRYSPYDLTEGDEHWGIEEKWLHP